ncbi:MAG: hypothetical protein ACJ768_11760 [Gaiellaceae bacterium]
MTPGQADLLGITSCTAGVAAILAAICAADRHVDTWTRRRAGRREERAAVRTAETITRTAAKETQP